VSRRVLAACEARQVVRLAGPDPCREVGEHQFSTVRPVWITSDVDLPEELLAAQTDETLVIFVGAGVSNGPPSNLPLFDGLAREIASDASRTIADDDLRRPDRFLGDLDSADVDVHVRARAIIGSPSSIPNPLHDALLRVPRSIDGVRVVTTNYDLHLSAVNETRFEGKLPEFDAPALPLGDDFRGLVYLHGSVRQDPRRLVLTDVDFGHAYLTEAWAARFLWAMFRRYVVLFVGYSHSDVVMDYLARALPRDAKRFALTPEPDPTYWRRLGVVPVPYPKSGERGHAALTEAVEAWADRSHWELLDHRRRVADLVGLSPPEDPVGASYLERVIANPATVGFFVEHARGEAWLRWATENGEFAALFRPAGTMSECGWPLAHWFAQNFVADTDKTLSHAALAVVQALGGGGVSTVLWRTLASALHLIGDAKLRATWLAVVISTAPETSEALDYLLSDLRWPDDASSFLLLFDHLTTPELVLQPTFRLPTVGGSEPSQESPVQADIQLRGDDYWLRETWRKVSDPTLQAARPLLPIIERQIERAHALLEAIGQADQAWDPLSFHRSAIEPHPQDEHNGSADLLIDIARDVLLALLESEPDAGDALLGAWTESTVPVLRRLAVFGWAQRTDVVPDDKLKWLHRQGILFDFTTKHEVFRLIATALPGAGKRQRKALVRNITEAELDDAHRDYLMFNHLIWVTQVDPKLRSAQRALDEIRALHPEFLPREHPDFDSWTTVGFVPRQLPITADEFHRNLNDDPDSAVASILEFRERDHPFDGPTWSDALELVASVTASWPRDGTALLAVSSPDDVEALRDVWRAATRGWSKATLTDDEWSTAIEALKDHPVVEFLVDDIAVLLEQGVHKADGRLPLDLIPRARELATALWASTDGAQPDASSGDRLTRAINHWAGRLAEFWVHTVSAEWTADTDAWSGLSPETAQRLTELVSGTGDRHSYARAVFGSQLQFFFGADEVWCESVLLPIFDWSRDEQEASEAWDGYLGWGRWHDRLLASGLLRYYEQTVTFLGTPLVARPERLVEHLAVIAVFSSIDPLVSGWLHRFVTAATIDLRIEWARFVASTLSNAPESLVRDRWDTWVRPYWTGRIESVPAVLTSVEAGAMAEWVLGPGVPYPGAVALVQAVPARLGEHSRFIYRLAQSDLPTQFPGETVGLLSHLLSGSDTPFYGCPYLEEITRAMAQNLAEDALRPIIQEALRLGCSDAANWTTPQSGS
jgi:Domain of unknown function (DUF4020)/SIR2-like domain